MSEDVITNDLPVPPAVTRGRRISRFVAVILASLVLAGTLVFVGGRIAKKSIDPVKATAVVAAVKASQTEVVAQQAVTDQVASCVAGNKFRSDDLAKWNKLAQVLGPFDATTSAKLKPFFDFVEASDAPRTCSALKATP